MDYYGASFVAFVLAIAELITFGWIYGVPRFCKDTEFMLGFRPNLYWRLCWRYIVIIFNLILLYLFINGFIEFLDSWSNERHSIVYISHSRTCDI